LSRGASGAHDVIRLHLRVCIAGRKSACAGTSRRKPPWPNRSGSTLSVLACPEGSSIVISRDREVFRARPHVDHERDCAHRRALHGRRARETCGGFKALDDRFVRLEFCALRKGNVMIDATHDQELILKKMDTREWFAREIANRTGMSTNKVTLELCKMEAHGWVSQSSTKSRETRMAWKRTDAAPKRERLS